MSEKEVMALMDFLDDIRRRLGDKRFAYHKQIIGDMVENVGKECLREGGNLEDLFADKSLVLMIVVVCALQEGIDALLYAEKMKKEQKKEEETDLKCPKEE